MPEASVLHRAVRRTRRHARELVDAAGALRSPARTALRISADRQPPPPSEFARFGARSFVVPPARIAGAAAIEIGDDVLVLEDVGLAVDAAGGARLTIGDRTR